MTLSITAFLFALTLAFNVSAQTLDTTKAVEDLPNLVKVNEDLLRGGRPTAAGMKKLKALGVTTILNIENSEEHIEADRKFAAANGLRFISVPFATFKKPTDEKVDYVLKIMRDRSMGRVYLHCKHGRDRTGMIMGLYRVEADGWHPKTAYQEMKDRGFRTILWELKDYYKDRTNY
jgi:protein tyrosine/serine phosphatase